MSLNRRHKKIQLYNKKLQKTKWHFDLLDKNNKIIYEYRESL